MPSQPPSHRIKTFQSATRYRRCSVEFERCYQNTVVTSTFDPDPQNPRMRSTPEARRDRRTSETALPCMLGARGVLLKPGTEKLEIRNKKCGNEEMAGTNEGFTDCVCPCWLEEAQSECSEPEWEPWQVVDAVAWVPGDTIAY